MTLNEVLSNDEKFRYQLLSRLEADCLFYLGNGNKKTKYLWASNESEHIFFMKEIWKSFPESKKPEWLSFNQILKYEQEMIN